MSNEPNEMEALEKLMRKALASEKMPGLRPDQLNDLHEKIAADGSNDRALQHKRPSGPRPSLWRWLGIAVPGFAVAFLALIFFQRMDHDGKSNHDVFIPPPQAEAPIAHPSKDSGKSEFSEGARPAAKSIAKEKKAANESAVSRRQADSLQLGGALAPGASAERGRAAKAERPAASGLAPAPFFKGHADKKSPSVVIVKDSVSTSSPPNLPVILASANKQIIFARSCYDTALQRVPTLAGDVRVKLSLGPNGKVASVELKSWTLGDQKAIDCITASLNRWQFPKGMAGPIELTLRFSP